MANELGNFSFGPELDREMNEMHRLAKEKEAGRSEADRVAELYEELLEFTMKARVDEHIPLSDLFRVLVDKEKMLRDAEVPKEETMQE
jgi:hypothetical protein